MGVNNKNLRVKTISDANNNLKMSLEDDLTISSNVEFKESLTVDDVLVDTIISDSTGSVIWNNPSILINGIEHKIEFQRSEVPEKIDGLKFWIDINQSKCWDGSSLYCEDLINRRKAWGRIHDVVQMDSTGWSGSDFKNSHFVSEMTYSGIDPPDDSDRSRISTESYPMVRKQGHKLNNMKVIKTDYSNNGANGGLLTILEQRPELTPRLGPYTMIIWFYSTQDKINHSNLNCLFWTDGQDYDESGGNYIEFQLEGFNYSFLNSMGLQNTKYHNNNGFRTYENSPINKGWVMMVISRKDTYYVPSNDVVSNFEGRHIGFVPNLSLTSFHALKQKGFEKTISIGRYFFDLNGTANDGRNALTFGGRDSGGNRIGGTDEGYLGPILFYDRSLTDIECKKIFDYYKPRFDIE